MRTLLLKKKNAKAARGSSPSERDQRSGTAEEVVFDDLHEMKGDRTGALGKSASFRGFHGGRGAGRGGRGGRGGKRESGGDRMKSHPVSAVVTDKPADDLDEDFSFADIYDSNEAKDGYHDSDEDVQTWHKVEKTRSTRLETQRRARGFHGGRGSGGRDGSGGKRKSGSSTCSPSSNTSHR